MTAKKIVMLLDASGSMGGSENKVLEIISSVNSFIKDQRELDSSSNDTFTLVRFNGFISTIIDNKKITEIPNLVNGDYVPQGMTALYDAIGTSISKFENEKDVMLVIVTDGEDTSSREYSFARVKELLKKVEDNNGWKTIFLTCDRSAFEQGARLGVASTPLGAVNVSMNNVYTPAHHLATGVRDLCSNTVSAFRKNGSMGGLGTSYNPK
jgi:Mg-chelatase subunit ChlD